MSQLLAHFGLKRHPFARSIPKEGMLRHRGFEEALGRLRFTVELDGIAVLVADAGCGKSLLLGELAGELQQDGWGVHYFAHSTVGPFSLVNVLARKAGLVPKRSRGETALILTDHLVADDRKHLLVLDEARDYLARRVHGAGAGNNPLFEEGAVDAIFDATGGVPRRINNVATASLIVTASRGRRLVSAQDVHDARPPAGIEMGRPFGRPKISAGHCNTERATHCKISCALTRGKVTGRSEMKAATFSARPGNGGQLSELKPLRLG